MVAFLLRAKEREHVIIAYAFADENVKIMRDPLLISNGKLKIVAHTPALRCLSASCRQSCWL